MPDDNPKETAWIFLMDSHRKGNKLLQELKDCALIFRVNVEIKEDKGRYLLFSKSSFCIKLTGPKSGIVEVLHLVARFPHATIIRETEEPPIPT